MQINTTWWVRVDKKMGNKNMGKNPPQFRQMRTKGQVKRRYVEVVRQWTLKGYIWDKLLVTLSGNSKEVMEAQTADYAVVFKYG